MSSLVNQSSVSINTFASPYITLYEGISMKVRLGQLSLYAM